MTILFLGFAFTTCTPQDTTASQTDFYGVWTWNQGPGIWDKVAITSNKLEYVNCWGHKYILENLTWTSIPGPSATHPNGYKITGKVTEKNTYTLYQSNGHAAGVNDIAVDYWYLSKNKTSLTQGDLLPSSTHEPKWGPFNK